MRVVPRSLAFVALTAMLCVVGAGALVAPAGAQTQVFSCTYDVAPTTVGPGGGVVTVQGFAPGTSIVRIFADGVLVATADAAPTTGFFITEVFVAATVEITVAVDDYPGTPCIGVGSEGAGQIRVGPGGLNRGRLPTTGGSGTSTAVLAGLCALSVGLVLVAATRRRAGIRGRG